MDGVNGSRCNQYTESIMAKKKVESELERFGSIADLDMHLAEYATLSAQVEKETAKYNEEEQKRRESLTEKTASAKARMLKLEQSFMAWAEDNRHEFGDKKSLDLTHGIIAFRATPPAVKTKKGFTFASALELIKRSKKLVDRFVRTKEELDKEGILRAYSVWEAEPKNKDGVSSAELAECGLEVQQSENFYVEPKLAVEVANG